jgi:lysophospholipase L1-like esterase
MSSGRTWLLGLAAAGIGIFVGAALAEGAVRLLAAVNHQFGDGLRGFDPMAVEIEPHGEFGYRQRPNSVLHYFNGTTASANALGYRGPLVPITPAPGTVRILLFGGSTTHGYAVSDDQTIDAYMRAILRERYPTQHFDVVNLALDGYDTHQHLERLRSDGLRMHPTIVIMNDGINDVRNAWFPHLTDPDPRTLLWGDVLNRLRAEHARGRPTVWTLIKHYSYLARMPGYIRDQLRRRAELRAHRVTTSPGSAPLSAPVASADSVHGKDGPPYPDAAELFEKNVRRIVSLSLANGAAVLLSTPPSSLRSYAPTATSAQTYWVWNAKITQDYRDSLAARLKRVEADEQREHHPVRYVAPSVPLPFFLDDCHLKPDGNRVVAETFVDAIAPFLPAPVTQGQTPNVATKVKR